MISFLKRFIWPSRISQESVGAALAEQRIEIEQIRKQVSETLRVIEVNQPDQIMRDRQISKKIADLSNIVQTLQTHLFDFEFSQAEHLKSLKSAIGINLESHSAIQSHNADLLKRMDAIVGSEKEQTELMTGFKVEFESIHSAQTAYLKQLENLKSALSDSHKTIVTQIETLPEPVDLNVVTSQLTSDIENAVMAIQNRIEENRNLTIHEVTTVGSLLNNVSNMLEETKIKVQEITDVSATGFDMARWFDPLASRLDEAALAIQNKSDENRNLTVHEVTTLHSDIDAVKNKVLEMQSHLLEKIKDAPEQDLTPLLSGLTQGFQETQQSLKNANTEGRNILMHEITTQQTQIFEQKNMLLDLERRLEAESVRQAGEIIAAFSGLSARHRNDASSVVPSPQDLSMSAALEKAESFDPKLFPMWHERMLAVKEAFEKSGKHGNAANSADPYSAAFKAFVEAHAQGAILDIGCGVHGKPHYLTAFHDDQIAGIDPLEAMEPSSFVRRIGIGEYIPWSDNSFDTLISATAIDHVLSLDKSFDEMLRVLKPGGQVLMWVGSVAGSRKFTPKAEDYKPADQYHLFHIDKAWFEPELENYFKIGAQVSLWLPQHEHVFYQLLEK